MKKEILVFIIIILSSSRLYSQNIDLVDYEIYINDSLISKSDFMMNSQNLTEEKTKSLEFRPITDGDKIAYYLSGKLYSKGTIINRMENGNWEFWHPNGNKAREGEFIDGKPNGIHKYWYENGALRGIGEWFWCL